jgi:hypothetical protein
MNQFLLLLGLFLLVVVVTQGNKKSMKSVSKSVNGKNTNALVLLFCVFILFMCMQKKSVEGFNMMVDNCPEDRLYHIYDPNSEADHIPVCITMSERGLLERNTVTEPEEQPVKPPAPLSPQAPGNMQARPSQDGPREAGPREARPSQAGPREARPSQAGPKAPPTPMNQDK